MLLLTMHHIVSDGWSMAVLVRELNALYAALCVRARASTLPALPVQYADYALWQRSWLQGEVLERQLELLARAAASKLETLQLPTDRPRPAGGELQGRGASLCSWRRSLSQQLTELGRREGVTLYMVLLAAFQVLLSRYSGQTDIVVGSPIAGRTHRELEELIGFFVNTLVLRTDTVRRSERSERC